MFVTKVVLGMSLIAYTRARSANHVEYQPLKTNDLKTVSSIATFSTPNNNGKVKTR